jgi:glycosyltransferase involved in cell wall biosynthesis
MMPLPSLSIIVPVLNEEETIGFFLEGVRPVLASLDLDYEIIFIDDGSTDGTARVVQDIHANDPRIKLVRLSRNFGKEAALTAGLEWSRGAAVIPMDVDLQDPPELIPEFVRLWRDGFDIVFGQRVERSSDSRTKRVSAGMFYRIFNAVAANPIDHNAGDFRLMTRRVVDATLQLRERNRFMKGLFAWVGYRSAAVPYERPPRAAGTTKFNYWKLWNFALDGITSFSTAPLKVWTYVGSAVALGAILYTLVVVVRTLAWGRDVPGYASLMVVVLVLGAVQLISLGVIGEYLGRLYLEVKRRPIYLLDGTAGFADDDRDIPPAPRDTPDGEDKILALRATGSTRV